MGNCSDSLIDFTKEINPKPASLNTGSIGRRNRGRTEELLLIGDSNVGKSSLLLRFTDNTFTDNFMSTIGVDFKILQMEINNRNVKLQIWDTAGQERFRTITASYYRGAQAVLLVYDVMNKESLRNVHKWLEEIDRYSMDNVIKVLVGNKSDCDKEDRVVSFDEGRKLAQQHNMIFFETSAKSGYNVTEMFNSISTTVMNTSY